MASRKIIRPSTVTPRDGFSPEAVEDLLVSWSAAWSLDPAYPSRLVLDQVRAMPKDALERCCGPLWALRIGVPAHQQELALRALEALGAEPAPLFTLALRDVRLAPIAGAMLAAANVTASFPAFVSVLRKPGDVLPWARKLVPCALALFAPDPGVSWPGRGSRRANTLVDGVPPEIEAWVGWRIALPDEVRAALKRLLHDIEVEGVVRSTLAERLCDVARFADHATWSGAAGEIVANDELAAILDGCLADPVVSEVVCNLLMSRPRQASLRSLRLALAARAADVRLLMACAACGDQAPLLEAFDHLPPDDQRRTIWVIDHYGRSAGRRFLLKRLERDTTDLEVRRAILSSFSARHDHSVTSRFQHLWQ